MHKKEKNKFKNMSDFYSGIDKLVILLSSEGHDAIVLDIQRLLKGSKWSTEASLLGRLGLYLRECRVPASKKTLSLMNECKDFCQGARRIVGGY